MSCENCNCGKKKACEPETQEATEIEVMTDQLLKIVGTCPQCSREWEITLKNIQICDPSCDCGYRVEPSDVRNVKP